MTTPKRFNNLQMLRFIASLIVVFAHVELYRYSAKGFSWGFFGLGAFGVDIFFVISGFIMVHVSRDLGTGLNIKRGWQFFLKRVLRIVPLYYLFTLLTVLLTYIFMHTHAELNEQIKSLYYTPNKLLDTQFIIKSLTFSNPGFTPVYAVGWTLDLEFRFYLLFAIAIALGIPVWMFFIGFTGAVLYGCTHSGPLTLPFFNPLYLEFSMGGALYYLYNRFYAVIGVRSVLCLFSVAAFTMCAFYDPYMADTFSGFLRPFTLGISATCITWLFLSLEGRFEPPKFVVFLGNGSYSMYLTHWLVMTLLPGALFALGLQGRVPFTYYVFGSVAIAVLASIAVYIWVEQPINRIVAKIQRGTISNKTLRQSGLTESA